jgi:hypothetical protein
MQEQFVQVSLSIRVFPNTRTDKELTHWLVREKKTSLKAGRWVRHKLNPERMEPVTKVAGEIRRRFDETTLWWARGLRLVPVAVLEGFRKEFEQRQADFRRAVNDFVASYPDAIAEAKKMHNGTFVPEDYPAPEEIAGCFGMRVEYFPMPAPEHFPAQWSHRLGNILEMTIKSRLAAAELDFWERMEAPIRHMAETLSVPNKKFWDSLVDNVREIALVAASTARHLNPEFKARADELLKMLQGVTPDALRDNPSLRKEIAVSAAKAAEKIAGIARRIVVEKDSD